MKRFLIRATQWVVTGLVTWFLAKRLGLGFASLGKLDASWWQPDWLWFTLASLVLFGGNLMSGVVWGRVAHDLGGPRLAFGTSIRVFLVANLGRYVPGKVWQIAGLALLAKRRGVPASIATGAAILGHGISLVSASMLGSIVILRHGSSTETEALLWAGSVVGLLALGLTPPVFRRLVTLWMRVARVEDRPPQLRPKVVLGWVALFLLNWMVYGFAFTLLARSFGLHGALLDVAPAFLAAYVLGYVAIFAPAGIGVREVVLSALLGPIVGQTAAAGLAVVARVWTTVIEVGPAAVLWGRELSLPHSVPSQGASGG